MNAILETAVDILLKHMTKDQFLEFAIALDSDPHYMWTDLIAFKAAELDPENYTILEDFKNEI